MRLLLIENIDLVRKNKFINKFELNYLFFISLYCLVLFQIFLISLFSLLFLTQACLPSSIYFNKFERLIL